MFQDVLPPSYQLADLKVCGCARFTAAYLQNTNIGCFDDASQSAVFGSDFNTFFGAGGGRWHSSGSSAIIQFRSDHETQYGGFELIVSLV